MPDREVTRAKAREMLPGYMVDGMLRYIEQGHSVGGFLTALLTNDLRRTFERADSTNAGMIRTYVEFLYNYAPSDCWGSPAKFDAWLEEGGLDGRERPKDAAECAHCGGEGIEPTGMSHDAGDGEGEDRPCSVCSA